MHLQAMRINLTLFHLAIWDIVDLIWGNVFGFDALGGWIELKLLSTALLKVLHSE